MGGSPTSFELKSLLLTEKFLGAATGSPILFSFRLRYVTLDIYIICVSMRNYNNKFILRETWMADFECRQLEIQLEMCAEALPNIITSVKALLNLRNAPK